MKIFDLFFPPVCASCKDLLPFRGFLDCNGTKDRIPLCNICLPQWEKEKAQICGVCLEKVAHCKCATKAMNAAGCKTFIKLCFYRPGNREDVGNRIIYRIKDHADAATVRFLAKELAVQILPALHQMKWEKQNLFITYLPRRRKTVLRGGTDQAKELAAALAKELELPLCRMIERSRNSTKPQKFLSAKQRIQNAQSAFYLRKGATAKGCNAILVDDIVTSGASMSVGARLLRKTGVRKILPVAVASDDCNRNPTKASPSPLIELTAENITKNKGNLNMNYVIQNRQPELVFHYFEQISAIPRGSFHEEQIADYLVQFAAERGLFCTRDIANNVFIRMPASPDRAQEPPVLFQGHTDMVCEKNSNVEHDFLKDPIRLVVDGDLLHAQGTTLGGDDGIAVAMMLALLDGAVPSHPTFECLFTTAEEVGLDGAKAFDYSQITATRMLNLDSEDLGIVTAGCAGGVRTDFTLTCESIPAKGEFIRVNIGGLMGGHSGADIACGRANANRLMGRLLAGLMQETDMHLVSLEGGSKDNAIPRECSAVLSVENAAQACRWLSDFAGAVAKELSQEDAGFSLSAQPADICKTMLSARDTARAVAVMTCLQNGVLEMSKQIPGLVEYSRNLGVIRQEGNQITFVFSHRSSVEAQLDAAQREMNLFAQLAGITARHYSRYPGWEFAPESDLRKAYCKAFQKVTGNKAQINVIHAGLECGIIRSHLPNLDMISIGPDLRNIHSPAEALVLPSVEVFWKVLEEFLSSSNGQ